MITVVLTYRDRDLKIVENCFDSLLSQSNKEFKIVLINYGSTITYSDMLELFLKENTSVEYINCDVSQQLWNKSRAINIALKKCDTPYFFVADIDMIFREDFIERLYEIRSEDKVTYFQVGFLNKKQTEKELNFTEYKINFNSNAEATGMTLYPTELLMKINGFDEFYHGWGSEDTDVHIRLKNLGATIEYYDKEILILHQWHPKFYRSLKNKAPFHTLLEKINSKYLRQAKEIKKIKANLNYEWGLIPNEAYYNDLSNPMFSISITNETSEVDALLRGTLFSLKGSIVFVEVKKCTIQIGLKNAIKKMIGRKHQHYYDLEIINNLVLETIISSYRNQPYQYEYSIGEAIIRLKIKL